MDAKRIVAAAGGHCQPYHGKRQQDDECELPFVPGELGDHQARPLFRRAARAGRINPH
jgi:hypothetical protein